ncbi:28703_t:CDS:1, partial [Gigaspora margarita]
YCFSNHYAIFKRMDASEVNSFVKYMIKNVKNIKTFDEYCQKYTEEKKALLELFNDASSTSNYKFAFKIYKEIEDKNSHFIYHAKYKMGLHLLAGA